jgi:cold shock CspA family protein
MPEGKLVWFDTNIGRGRIEDSTGKYTVRADDMADQAKVEGAFVHFDVERDEPHDRAVNVTLREGTRNDPNQHRFGHNP